MQSYPFHLDAVITVRPIFNEGDFFQYESGSSLYGDVRITVTPENGEQITLKPGQGFRIPRKVASFTIKSWDGVSTIDGTMIIGAGQFFDNTPIANSNAYMPVKVNNTTAERVPVTLDTTQSLTIGNGAGNRVPVAIDPAAPLLIGNTTAQRVPVTLDTTQALTIGNTTAQRVPVTLDTAQALTIGNTTAQRVPVTLDATQTINGGAIYATAWADGAVTNGATIYVTTLTTVNGAWVEAAEIAIQASAGNTGVCVLLANASVPASATDGHVILAVMAPPSGCASKSLPNRIKIPAGKYLWVWQAGGMTAALKSVLFNNL